MHRNFEFKKISPDDGVLMVMFLLSRLWTGSPPGILAVLILWANLSGCVVMEVGTNLTNTVQGEYYLDEQDPEKGEKVFSQEVKEHPENALSNYYYGRLLLRSKKAKEALPYLQKAGNLEPEDADYQFWLGVAYGLLKQTQQERAKYEHALEINEEHLQAITALGHWYLQNKQYTRSLQMYSRALVIWPENPAALYNRGLAFSKLGRRDEEQKAWHRYLGVNSSGRLARNAVEHLNSLGDFSYRNYRLGALILTVREIRFKKFTAELERASYGELELIGETVASMETGVLQVVVYLKKDTDLARKRAQNIRKVLLSKVPGLSRERIGISWFGESQRNRKKRWKIEESVDFFLVNK